MTNSIRPTFASFTALRELMGRDLGRSLCPSQKETPILEVHGRCINNRGSISQLKSILLVHSCVAVQLETGDGG